VKKQDISVPSLFDDELAISEFTAVLLVVCGGV
jgi:hypothetical protein